MADPLKQFSFLTAGQIDKFDRFCEILLRENANFNLTAIKTPAEVRLKHFVDSLMAVEFIKDGAKLIDIGSGAGLPGLALAIAKPELSILSVEATGKKAKFQQTIIDELDIKNAKVIHERAEALSHDKTYREAFDIAAGRAVANMAVLAELALPFVKVGGKMIAWKSAKAGDEIEDSGKAIEVLGGKLIDGKNYSLTGQENLRIVAAEKIKKTPLQYPREFKDIKNTPLQCSNQADPLRP